MTVLNLTFLRRCIQGMLIQPVTQAAWYTPLTPVKGGLEPVELDLHTDFPVAADILNTITGYLHRHQTRAFLVMQHGRLVHRHYEQFAKNNTFNSMSMVKTVTAIAIGIAIDQGFIGGVHEAAAQYLPEFNRDDRRNITIENLLTMQSGLQSDVLLTGANALKIVALYFGTNLAKQVFRLKSVAPAGTYFEYNNYNTQLLGEILERASGLTVAEFFSKYIWQPLECHDASLWLDRKGGQARAFAGFFAQPEDWLRLGHLFLTAGRYVTAGGEVRQIVPAAWLKEMVIPRNTLARGLKTGANDYGFYGYQIWLSAHDKGLVPGIPWFEASPAKQALDDPKAFYFEGLKGQYLYISPQHDLVMLRMGEAITRKTWDGSYAINALTRALTVAKIRKAQAKATQPEMESA